jgi:predicted DNA-binding mobile mystery protein A
MPRPKKTEPDFLALQRQQLDARFKQIGHLDALKPPKKGWVNTIRIALGMNASQLGKRLHMSRQGVLDLERREANETITVGTLRKAANALNADIVIGLLPRRSLNEMVHAQASSKAASERNRVAHTMRLESQDTGIADVIDPRKNLESWMTKRIGKLWD